MKLKKALGVLAIFIVIACSHNDDVVQVPSSILLEEVDMQMTATPFQPGGEISEPGPEPSLEDSTEKTPEESENEELSLAFAETVPSFFVDIVQNEEVPYLLDEGGEADLILVQSETCEDPVYFVYALVAPFPTTTDSIGLKTIEAAWAKNQAAFNSLPLLMTKETYQVFAEAWGEAKPGAIELLNEGEILETAWGGGQFAVIPFHKLDGRWKVMQIDKQSVLNAKIENSSFPLSFGFCWMGSEQAQTQFAEESATNIDFISNRDLNKLTSVTMTGVTALVRATANKMENMGITYPGEKIRGLLLNADFTHISNEVAFANDCPYPDPYQTGLRFCSSPKYMELLEYLDIDIIELTGNHIQDWGREPFIETLGLYESGGYLYYAGGRNLSEAKEPLLIDHNGNKLAFIGCNAVGPPGAFATENLSGNANCDDYGWILQSVQDLTKQGYLVIVTLQHNEFYGLMKTGPQMRDFNPIAQAGAVIVSGSQAHYPNPFGFEGSHFIHYGLGNLFFDQMDVYIADGIQREFLDTHYFYDGRYISTEVFTLYLEDFAQPRMMTEEERITFLLEAFNASGW